MKQKEKGYFSFGSTIHNCTEHFFRVKFPPPPSLEELLRFYEDNWLSEGYNSEEEEAQYKAFGREMLTGFWKIHTADFRIPLALEKAFYLDVDGIKLRGFIDRVDKLESGGLAIVDYKTNRDLFTTEYLEDNLQLTIYQLAAEQMYRLPVEKLTLYHMRSNTPCTCPPRGKEQLQKAREMVLEVADNISRQLFPATENQFCPCDFAEHCPYYKHLYMKEAATAGEQPRLDFCDITEAVEKYAATQQRIKEFQAEMDELKGKIVAFCQAEEINRVFGSNNAITYKIVERTGFNAEQVKSLLEPSGLWDTVLSLDTAKLKQLLADDSIPKDIRDGIAVLKEVTSAYPQLWVKKIKDEE